MPILQLTGFILPCLLGLGWGIREETGSMTENVSKPPECSENPCNAAFADKVYCDASTNFAWWISGQGRPLDMSFAMWCTGARGGSCFASDSKLNTWTESGQPGQVEIKDAKRGDYVRLNGEEFDDKVGKIDIVICQSGSFEVIPFAKAQGAITPWHPMLVAGEWAFPEEAYTNGTAGPIFKPKTVAPEICNVMLAAEDQRQHSRIVIDTVTAAALGHDLTDNDVIRHDFFGSHASVSAAVSSFADAHGRVTIHGVTRGDNGMVNGFLLK